MAAVTVFSDFGAQVEEICHYFHIFPFYLLCSKGTRCHDLSFLIFNLKPALSLSSFTLIKRFFSSSLLSAIRLLISEVVDVSPAYPDSSFGLPRWLIGKKKSTCNTGDVGDTSLIPGSGRSPGGGHGNPLQYSCLESITDRGPWRVTVHRVAKSWTWPKWLRVFYSIAKVYFRTDIPWVQAMLRAWECLEPSACAHWKCLLGGRDEDNHHARFLTGDAGEQIA